MGFTNRRSGNARTLDRRTMVGLLGSVGFALFAGCGSSDDETATTGGTGGSGGSDGGAGGSNDGAGQGGQSGQAGATGNGGSGPSTVTKDWATGGTAAMTAASSYPDPFAIPAAACTLTCVLTQGPCWAPTAPLRQDVSESQPGVPLRLVMRVVESDGCTPVSGAEVEIWHCALSGLYSAHDVENVGFCTNNDAKALAAYFFRGRAISNAAGEVVFDTCFPGWYASRAIHIHFAIRRSAHVGESTTTNATCVSQFFFPEELTASIFAKVAGYVDRGQPDTSLAKDSVLGSVTDQTPYLLDYAQMSDGAMLAWKQIAISDTDSCGPTGSGGTSGGPGGPGGPGMGGGPPGMGGGPPMGGAAGSG